jgi:hypothetical protein
MEEHQLVALQTRVRFSPSALANEKVNKSEMADSSEVLK